MHTMSSSTVVKLIQVVTMTTYARWRTPLSLQVLSKWSDLQHCQELDTGSANVID